MTITPEAAAQAADTLDAQPEPNDQVRISDPAAPGPSMSLTEFVSDFGENLLAALNAANPPVYSGVPRAHRQQVLDRLTRPLFEAQANVVHAAAELLVQRDEHACIVCGEMGCGKTTIAVAIAAVLHAEGYRRTLVLCPPHLVYKWRREILEIVPDATVWILNGPDTLVKLLKLRDQLNVHPRGPEFFIIGRVRLRMGFHWRPAFARRRTLSGTVPCCPGCGTVVSDPDGEPLPVEKLEHEESRRRCSKCSDALWTLMRPVQQSDRERSSALLTALRRIPTIGPATAKRLVEKFVESYLLSTLSDNLYEFVNLMDERGEMFFSDRQAHRMERALANMEFSFGQGGYQPSEFVKRYLPNGTFDTLICDEAHEYKNAGSAQGQAMGVLASKARKLVLLTGTLMGGYADDLFYLLFRSLPRRMLEDGYRPSKQGSLTAAALSFMRQHGVLKDIYSTEQEGPAHKTARGHKTNVRTVKAPGFGPKGILRCILPFTIFIKLRDIGGNVLPSYDEEFREVSMEPEQAHAYGRLSYKLTSELKQALRRGDPTLLGVVLNVLLAWPDTCFRSETVIHPRHKGAIAFEPALFEDGSSMPKEHELVRICREEKAQGRKVLAYSTYTGKRDTTSRLKVALEREGFKVAVLRVNVDASRREDWIAEQIDRGIDVLITNPELVKTGLDLLEFPTIVFMQSGYNVYTLQQAARRSWRIGQKNPVRVIFLGYGGTSQMLCLALMARKIAVAQSTAGDAPESGLDILNQDGDSIEVALARQLAA